MKTLIVIGAGGQARETQWVVEAINRQTERYRFEGFAVTDLEALTDTDSRESVRGDYRWLEAERSRIDCIAVGIGTPATRRRVGAELRDRFPEIDFPALVHPAATLSDSGVSFGVGSFVSAGVVGTVGIELGAFSLLNMNVTIGHESRIGAGSVVGPGANIGGGVRIGDEVLIGSGAQVLQYRSIADGATVGAGAVVTRDVGSGETVVGVPARPAGSGPEGGEV